MLDEIVKLLDVGETFKNIFNMTSCTEEAFLKALNKQQETDEFTRISYVNNEIVAH